MKLRTMISAVALTTAATGAFAQDAAECRDIVMSDVGWTDITATTATTAIVLEALGYELPELVHNPVILGPDGGKLSKRHGAKSVLEYAEDGYLPDAVIVAEGGYEARGLVADIGFYSAKAQDVVVRSVRQMAAKAGRALPK